MKTLKFLLAVPCVLLMQTSFAQNSEHLKLSTPTPSVGEKVSLTYDPSGTVLEGKKVNDAVVYFLDNDKFPAADVNLKPDGKLWKGDMVIPANSKAFVVRLYDSADVDNNGDKGYVYLIYNKDKKQPVEGAFAQKAYLLWSGMGAYFAKIKSSAPDAMELYKKEFAMYPKSVKEYQDPYYTALSMSPSPEDKQVVKTKAAELAKSSTEADLRLAATLYARLRQKATSDSLIAVAKAKFQKGMAARNAMGAAFNMEKDPAKKEALYNAFISNYPESEEKNKDATTQDNFRLQLASAYLTNADLANYRKWEPQIKNKTNLASALNSVAYNWALKNEHLDDAAVLSKQSLDILDAEYAKGGDAGFVYMTPNQIKEGNRVSYYNFADSYALILYKQGKYADALKYQQLVWDNTKTKDAEITEHYAMILNGNGQYAKAMPLLETSIAQGKGNSVMKEELAKAFAKVKGSSKGYADYLAKLENASKNKVMADLAKEMISKPAPAFALKDMNGTPVSLASLKGKTVIVDFWATWCGPCKASFPGMQMAVNKYKDDPNVKFLFVDTWENGDNYLPGVKKFIADNKYSFNVLIDEKGEDGRQSKVVSSFGVDGIPTKFIIDKTGNIRFKHVGYSGSPDKLVEEITNMIELVNADASQKVSMLIRK